MQKIVLMSVLVLSLVAPTIASRNPNPRLGLRKTLLWCFTGIFIYVLALLFVYPHFTSD
jgi:hypothetical protein